MNGLDQMLHFQIGSEFAPCTVCGSSKFWITAIYQCRPKLAGVASTGEWWGVRRTGGFQMPIFLCICSKLLDPNLCIPWSNNFEPTPSMSTSRYSICLSTLNLSPNLRDFAGKRDWWRSGWRRSWVLNPVKKKCHSCCSSKMKREWRGAFCNHCCLTNRSLTGVLLRPETLLWGPVDNDHPARYSSLCDFTAPGQWHFQTY